ncbi:MAG: helix-turn-helix domain-containing protein [Acidobacteriota bacterium]
MNDLRRGLIAPRQERSKATLDRLLDATEELLGERPWAEITVAEIVSRSATSVGSFYARFPAKEALVEALLERYHEEARRSLAAAASSAEWQALSLAERARRLIAEIVALCRHRRGLLRLRLQRRLAGLESEANSEPPRDREVVAALVELFGGCVPEIGHDQPESALRFALRMVDGVVISAIALDDVSQSYGPVDDSVLIAELTRAFVAYLQAPPGIDPQGMPE